MRTQLWHTMTIDDTFNSVHSQKNGLSPEAVLARQEQFGKNSLPTKQQDRWWQVLLRQFMSPMIVVLLFAAGISFALHELVDFGVILAAVGVNTIIGFIQEYKANKALEKLHSLVQPKAVVLRDGKETDVFASEMVPGDVLVLHAGDRVTADARLIEGFNIQTNEAALTGESLPISKTIEPLDSGMSLADRTNMIYAGTTVVGGRGHALVVATGLQTELGKIAKLVDETEETDTPLQVQLGTLARWLAVLVLLLVGALFVLGIMRGRGIVEMFEMSVALSVAAIPEGLIVSVTIILAIGMQRILRRKSLVRRLVAAETLGSVSIICSDKTGTITEGEMSVTHLYTYQYAYPLPLENVHKEEERDLLQDILKVMALCNDAAIIDAKELRGSPTERALLEAVHVQKDVDVNQLRKNFMRVAEIPFDSSYKYMVTAHKGSRGGQEQFLKGAPDIMFQFCSHIQVGKRRLDMTPEHIKTLRKQISTLTGEGIRVLGLAKKHVSKTDGEPLSREHLEAFTFLGFVGLQDPLRKQAPAQIAAAKMAGIHTIIVTGDHPETARAIAIEAGLNIPPGSVVVGSELDTWSDEELERRVSRVMIYARVEPRHKIRIVKAWQARGEVVAMTGDGINDAPAIKAADIGVALGSGTEVAKQSSDLVLINNNLGTITSAIEEGRVIFDNIRKTTVYLLADSFTEMVLIGGSILMGLPIPLLPAQILWINLVADSFPNVGLTLEPAEKDVMKLPPRPRDEAVLNKEMMLIIFFIGAVTDFILFLLYIWLLGSIDDIGEIRSIMFAAVGIDSLLYIFAVKSFRKTIFRINPFSNLWLVAGVLIGFGLMLLALIHPFFQEIFEITPLHLYDWILLLMIGVIKLVAIEITKEIFLLKNHKKSHAQ